MFNKTRVTKIILTLALVISLSALVFSCGKNTKNNELMDTTYESTTSDPQSIDPYYLKNADNKSVSFGNPDFEIYGTLSVPLKNKKQDKFPAVILVGGSGPQDRDETIGPNKVFRDIAQELVNRGIAVLRYDKRTLTHSAKYAQNPDIYKLMTVDQEVVEDAIDGISLLANDERIDRKAIFVVGHSLGGNQTPKIANLSLKEYPVAGMIIMAGNVSELQNLMYDQLKYIADLDGKIDDAEKLQIMMVKQARDYINSHSFNINSDYKKSLQVYPAYWLSLKGYNPVELAAELRMPTLVLQGMRDYQVPLSEFEKWEGGLRIIGDKGKFVTFEGLNHLFMSGEGKSTPEEYLTKGRVDKEVIDSIAEFIEENS